MKPSELFEFKPREGSVNIQLKDGRTAAIIGSSMPTYLPPEGGNIDNFIVFPNAKIGILAMIIDDGRQNFSYILQIRNKDTTPLTTIQDEKWEPDENHYGGIIKIDGRYYLHAKTKDGWYITNPLAKNSRYVPDANLICRYLIGAAASQELENAHKQTIQGKINDKLESTADALLNGFNDLMKEAEQMSAQTRRQLAGIFKKIATILEPENPGADNKEK